MKPTAPRRSRLRRASTLLALGLAAPLALAPRPAHALGWSWLAEKVASSLISIAMNKAAGYVFPQSGTDISNASLSDIQDMISTELDSVSYSSATTNYNAAVSVWYNYYRGTTLTSLEENADTLKTGSAFDTYLENALSSMQTCGFACAKMYVALAQIKVAAQIERYNVMKAINSLSPGTYGTTDLSIQLALAQTQAAAVLEQIMTYNSDFEGQFGGLSYQCGGWGDSCYACSPCDITTTRKFRSCNYCFTYTSSATGSSQTLCPTSDLGWSSAKSGDSYVKQRGCFELNGDPAMYFHDQYTCDGGSGETECTDIASNNGTLFRKQIMAAARDDQLGSYFYETIAALQKIVNKDVAYCGDGVCQIGETRSLDGQSSPWCSEDCTSSSYAKLTSLDMTRPSSRTTLLSAGDYNLNVNQYGDFLIQDSANTTYYWQTRTGASGGSGYTFSLQSDGNLCIYDSSDTLLWQSDTTTLNLTTDPPTADTLTLIDDGVLYLTDQYGNVWWESDTDFHVHAAVSDDYTQPRQCWTKGSQQVLASNEYYNLVWETNGNLNVYEISSGSTMWTSNTSGSSPYMVCNQEDGNLVIYNTSRSQIWSTSTGTGSTSCSSTSTTATGCSFGGYGGDLVLVGPQLRLATAAGDPTWSNGYCSGSYSWACAKDGEVSSKSVSTSDQCWTSSTTILSNDEAELDWTGSALVLYDKTPKLAGGSSNIQLWTPTTTAGAKVCYTSTGNLAIYTSNGSPVWQTGASSSTLTLAGCSLFQGASTTNYAKYASQTACTYGATSSVWGGY